MAQKNQLQWQSLSAQTVPIGFGLFVRVVGKNTILDDYVLTKAPKYIDF